MKNMKKLLFILIFILITGQVYAFSAIIRGDAASCLKKEWIKDMVSFANARDLDSFQAYFDTAKCAVLKKGLRVTVTEAPGIFDGIVGFVLKGVKFWTVREELENMSAD